MVEKKWEEGGWSWEGVDTHTFPNVGVRVVVQNPYKKERKNVPERERESPTFRGGFGLSTVGHGFTTFQIWG